MTQAPEIATVRLVLSPFRADDAPALERLAGAPEVADTTISIPHPYTRADAERFIASQRESATRGDEAVFGIRLGTSGELLGCVSLRAIDRVHLQAELGYWIGVPHWGRGYATEAAEAVVRYGFGTLALNRIYAHHMARNPASGRVLERVGMRREGVLRQRVLKWGRFEDVVVYAVVRDDLASAPG
ncbi:MAG: GNAT family N-acetyltransferase [Deltaproteobacteria bacterium]